VNLQKTNLIFKVEIEGPFKITESSTNSLEKYDLLNQKSLVSGFAPLTAFNLIPDSNVQLAVFYAGAELSNQKEWPKTQKNYQFGQLNIYFSNGNSQRIQLEGILLRPQLTLVASGHEGVPAADVLDFGLVHINNRKTITIFLTNHHSPPGNWKIGHRKAMPTKNVSEFTKTQIELEDERSVDDMSVFEFSATQVALAY